MEKPALIFVFFPVVAFCLAAFIEFRSTTSATQRLRSLIPTILGIVAFALLLSPQVQLHLTPRSSVTLSRVMTLFSSLIARSGVFITYSRRSSAVWVAIGGLTLTLFWMFNYVLV